jgi:regulator of replication initiation timing
MEPGYASSAAEDAHRRISALIRDRNSLMAEVEWLKRDVSQRIANVSKDRDRLMAEVEHLRSRLDEVTGKMLQKGK